MIYKIFGFDYVFNLQFFQLMFLCALLGLISKSLIQIVNNEYFVVGLNQVFVFTLLPVTGFIITSVISNNIALSLGMVGALSIVRFRTPVKNPLELVIYFYLITLGIVTSVDPSISINFSIFFALSTVGVEIYKFLSEKFLPKRNVNNQFSHYLRINLLKDYEGFDKSKNLIHKSFDNESFIYTMGFSDYQKVEKTILTIPKENIITYSIDVSNQ